MMEQWKKTLAICCFATFIVSIGMGQLAPMLPIYIEELGISDPAEISHWAGIIFGANFITLAIAAPIWGQLSDRYGRRPMVLRASLWLTIIMIGMGFARSVWDLAVLRLIQGAMSGFLGAVVSLIAQETPKQRSGWALGMFLSSQVGGALIGPLIGGFLAEQFNCRTTFIVIGCFCFLGFLAALCIKETASVQPQKNKSSFADCWKKLPQPQLIIKLAITNFILQFTLMSVHPIITVYIKSIIPETGHLALISGAVFSATGFASMISASPIGNLSDRIGPDKVLFSALIIAGFISIPQAFVTTPWQLGILRFILGIATAGLLPSINSLIRRYTPPDSLGRIYGFNQSAQFIGMFSGAFFGGTFSGIWGIPAILIFSGIILLANALAFRFLLPLKSIK